MSRLAKKPSGHLRLHPDSGHLGLAGFLFNIRSYTVTWTGSARLILNSTDYFTSGSYTRDFTAPLTNPSGIISGISQLSGANVPATYYGPYNTAALPGRVLISFQLGDGQYITRFRRYFSTYNPLYTITDHTLFAGSSYSRWISDPSENESAWTNVTLDNIALTINSYW